MKFHWVMKALIELHFQHEGKFSEIHKWTTENFHRNDIYIVLRILASNQTSNAHGWKYTHHNYIYIYMCVWVWVCGCVCVWVFVNEGLF